MLLRQTPTRFLCTSSFLIPALVALAAPVGQPALSTPERDAWSVLKRVYAEPFPVDAVAIQKRSYSPRSSVTTRLTVTRHRSLVSRTLEPLMLQGHVVWDDGRVLRRYDPDEKMVVKQPSPHQYRPSLSQRMAWGKANYTASMEEPTTIAGRQGLMILLTPTHEGMPQRRIVVDAEKPFILRSERMSSKKNWIVSVTTLEVRFEDPYPEEDSLPENVQEMTEWGPRPVNGFPGGSFESKFAVKLPEGAPMGFHLVARHAVGSSWDNACLAYRLSDGLASVTVYAWDTARTPHGPYPQTPVMAVGSQGLKFAAFGDVPSSVLTKIAQAFAQGEGANSEPRALIPPLTPIVEPNTRTS